MKRNKSTWVPLQPANLRHGIGEDEIALTMRHGGYDDPEKVRADLEAESRDVTYWINDIYQVARRVLPKARNVLGVEMIHLNIRRRDGKPIFRDWRHFQLIKNQLVGEECEGVEIYPAESRLSDSSNKYHIFCFADPQYRVPFGLHGRLVLDDAGLRQPGYRQRKLV